MFKGRTPSPRKKTVINPAPPTTTNDPNKDNEKFEQFGHQYQYFKEEGDPKSADDIINKLEITIFYDADHAHDLVTGRRALPNLSDHALYMSNPNDF